jgi:hypothetical protein
MKTQTPTPSVRRILWTDYPAFIATAIPIVAWIVCLAWAIDWRGDGPVLLPAWIPVYLAAAAICTVAGVGVVIWRIWLFHRLFRLGTQVRGKISVFKLRNDRGRVEYTYIFNRKEYNSGAHLHRNRQTKALRVGDAVTLMIDPGSPQRAYILDLYRRSG